jgi:hypothetical protein
MNLTSLVRKLESECKRAEKLARHYDAQADAVRDKLSNVAGALGKLMTGKFAGKKTVAKQGKRKMSAAGRARIIAAQKRRWAKVRSMKGQK